jgi:hypothetical protein
MGIVIDLKARRAVQPARAFARHHAIAPRFYCMRCDSELFRILESGLVRCGRCAADIPNLTLRGS